jgi:uncharacterized membrane protein
MQQSKRILFLDVLRALAVILMLQGHTISALGDFSDVSKSSLFYQVWSFIRGITAPLFIFTAGTVFIYLLKIDKPFFACSRVRKGLVRFVTLLTIGYLLNYPSLRIFDFADATNARWLKFFSVDALHLIAFGILFLIFLRFVSYKTGVNELFLYLFSALALLVSTPFVLRIPWRNITNPLVASYFSYGTGSFFPLFPYLFYIFAGAVLGYMLRNNASIYKKSSFSLFLVAAGTVLFLFAVFTDNIFYNDVAAIDYLRTDFLLTIQRLGIVLILAGILSFLLARSGNMPRFVFSLGRNSLLIYVLHLVLIYGCVLVPGLTFIWENSLSITNSVIIAISITIIFTILSILYDRKKIKFAYSVSR